ncbi:MAG: hypothetical protein ACPGUV_06880 [Polyangiales bacterium]
MDIDAPVLSELKALAKGRGVSLGKLVTEMTAVMLRQQHKPTTAVPFCWQSQSMEAQIDLTDREALWAALDEPSS